MKKFRNKGIGKRLFEKVFEWIETTKSFITLPEECYKDAFKRLLEKYNFVETSRLEGVYRDNRIEYFLMRINDESINVNKTKICKKILERTKIFKLRRKI